MQLTVVAIPSEKQSHDGDFENSLRPTYQLPLFLLDTLDPV